MKTKFPIYIKSNLPKKFNSVGFILFCWIFITPEKFDDKLIRTHEYVHYLQMKELWFIGFYPVYLWFMLFHKYEDHPMEIEAVMFENYTEEQLQARIKFNWKNY